MQVKRLITVFALGLGLTLALLTFLRPSNAAPASPRTLYVAPDGSDAASCDSSANRCRTIQRAVNVAAPNDEIRVAAGLYTGTQTIAASNGYTYTQIAILTKSLTLRGGYSTLDWNTSNPAVNPTVLDAQRHGRGISIVGTGTQTVTVDGLTLTGGDYSGLGNAYDNAEHGGGLYASGCALTLLNSVVTDNMASRVRASNGGGVYLDPASAEPGTRIENTVVISNYAAGESSIYGGGGLYATNVFRPLTITRSVFRENTSGTSGGGILLEGSQSLVTIQETDLISNTANTYRAGGLFASLSTGAELRLERVRFLGNRANREGTAVYVYPAGTSGAPRRVSMTNVLLAGNVITRAGADDYDAVLRFDTPYNNTGLDVSLAHVTAADNQAPTFLYAYQSRANRGMTVTLTNTLIVSATNAFAAEGIGSVVIQHTNTLTDRVTTLHKTLDGSPVFTAVNPLTGDPRLDANYRLQAGSAAIDAGVNAGVSSDLIGEFRPQGPAPDIGADEWDYAPAPPETLIITGLSSVVAQVSQNWTASIGPVTATQPLTYVWETTGLLPVTHTDRGLSDTVSLAWSTEGDKTITATASNISGTVVNTYSVQALAQPVLAMQKSGPAVALAGAPITYTLTVTNTGIGGASSVVITDALPVSASYLSGGTLAGNVVSWDIPTLAANGGITQATFVVTATQTITNSDYRVSASGGYSATGSVPVVTVVGMPALSISKSGPYGADVGGSITYKLTVVNSGVFTATGLVITDVLPVGAGYVSGGTRVGNATSWTIADLAPGAKTSATLVITATQTITNSDYRVISDGGYGAIGSEPVVTIVGHGTRHVATGGADGTNDCTNSASPCATIQHAANAANPNEEVRVAAGTYTGTRMVTASSGYTYTQVVFVDKSLVLRGGYTQGNWNTADPTANPTIINAERKGRGISIVGTGTQTVTVDGFTITGGDYTYLHNPGDGGNDVGGGLYADNAALTLQNSVISDNIASRTRDRGRGGGLYLRPQSAEPGTRIENTVVISNYAPGDSSIYGGGGMYAASIYQPMTITRSVFRDNSVANSGGGLMIESAQALVTLQETDILSNTAQNYTGGGAYISFGWANGALNMERVRFQNNRANEGQAALFLYASAGSVTPPRPARLSNVLFSGNATTNDGDWNAVMGVGYGGYDASFDLTLAHVTAADNRAPTFLYVSQTGSGKWTTATLTNTLLVSFTHAFVGNEGGSSAVLIRHTNTLTDQVANLHHTANYTPTFEAINTLTGDPNLDANYRLGPGSAAIDKGVDAGVTVDLDGDRRPMGALPDIGADEAWKWVFLPLVIRNP